MNQEEREKLLAITRKGKHTSKKVIHALILLNYDEGEFSDKVSNKDTAKVLQISQRTIDRVKKRFVEDGFEAALTNKPTTSIYERKVNGDKEAHLVALSCSEPPEGFSRWLLRLLVDKMVALNYSDKILHETVMRVLKKRT